MSHFYEKNWLFDNKYSFESSEARLGISNLVVFFNFSQYPKNCVDLIVFFVNFRILVIFEVTKK